MLRALFFRRKANTPRPRRWRFRLKLTVLGLLVLIAAAPTLLIRPLVLNIVLGRVLSGVPGSVHVGGASAGWMSPLVLEDVTVADGEGNPIVTAARVSGNRGLLSLALWHSHLGTITVENPRVTLVTSGGRTNAERAFAPWFEGERPASQEPSSPPPGVILDVRGATLLVRDADAKQEWQLGSVHVGVDFPTAGVGPISLSLRGEVVDTQKPGSVDVTLKAHMGSTAGGLPQAVEAKIDLEGIPMALARPFLRRFEPDADLDGRLAVHLDGKWLEGETGNLTGRLQLEKLALSGAMLGTDRLVMDRVEVPCQLKVRGTQVQLEQLAVRSEVAKVTLAGTLDPGRPVEEWLRAPDCRADVDVDLAKLASMLPTTLGLAKDLRLNSGKVTVHLESSRAGEDVAWEGKIQVTEVAGVAAGKTVEWRDPLKAEWRLRQGKAGLPRVERLEARGDCVRLEGSGNAETLALRGSYSLDILADRLGRFVDLGPTRPTGTGTLWMTAQRQADGSYRSEGRADLQRLGLGGKAPSWVDETFVVRFDATGSRTPTGAARVDRAGVHVEAGPDGADVDLTEPIADLGASLNANLTVKLRGELSRWQARLGPWGSLLEGWTLRGGTDALARVRITPEAYILEEARLGVNNPDIRGAGLTVREPALEATVKGRYHLASGKAELKEARLSCPAATVTFPTLAVCMLPTGDIEARGQGTVTGDLARLSRWQAPPAAGAAESMSGSLKGTLDLEPTRGVATAKLDVTIQQLTVGPAASPTWHDPNVRLTGRVHYEGSKDALRLEEGRLNGTGLNATVSGAMAKISGSQDLKLSGELRYDLEKLNPQVRNLAGPSVQLRGSDARPFRVEGSLAAANLTLTLGGEAGLHWETLQAYGCDIGRAEVKTRLEQGWMRLEPIDTTLNGGRLRLEPRVSLDTLEAHFPAGTVVERAKLTPAVCASALGYALPFLAQVGEANGEISVAMDAGKLPLSTPLQADVGGRIIVHRAHLGASPLLRELAVLLRGPAVINLDQEITVPFRVVNGRVHHSNLDLRFPELTIRTSGSVGFDGSLSLVADMPIPPKWLGTGRLSAAVANRTIRLPIAGTLSRPKLDERALQAAIGQVARESAADAARQGLEAPLKKLLGGNR